MLQSSSESGDFTSCHLANSSKVLEVRGVGTGRSSLSLTLRWLRRSIPNFFLLSLDGVAGFPSTRWGYQSKAAAVAPMPRPATKKLPQTTAFGRQHSGRSFISSGNRVAHGSASARLLRRSQTVLWPRPKERSRDVRSRTRLEVHWSGAPHSQPSRLCHRPQVLKHAAPTSEPGR